MTIYVVRDRAANAVRRMPCDHIVGFRENIVTGEGWLLDEPLRKQREDAAEETTTFDYCPKCGERLTQARMTQDELDALPEIGGIGQREEIRDGKKVIIPVDLGSRSLWNPVYYTDANGTRWAVATVDGVLSKQRCI